MQHPDEGTIHAWLDDELSADKGDELMAHVSDCPECAALVAEARGLVAASTRILTALDDVPGEVIPAMPTDSLAPAIRRRWYDRTDLRAAAAVLFVAGASLVVVRSTRDSTDSRATMALADKAQPVRPAADTAAAETRDRLNEMRVSPQPETQLRKTDLKTSNGAANSVASAETGQARAGAPASPDRRIFDRAAMQPQPMSALSASGAFAAPTSKTTDSALTLRDAAVVIAPRSASPAIGTIEGRVTDQKSGNGLPAANVLIEGTHISATTDADGRFSIAKVPVGATRLQIRRIGYEPGTIPLEVGSGERAMANAALSPAMRPLDEIVVSGVAGARLTAPLRVVRVDSSASTRRTVYEVSQGVEVTLAESPIATVESDFRGARQDKREAANAQISAEPPQEKAAAAAAGRISGVERAPATATAKAVPPAIARVAPVPAPLNVISWTDRGRHYTLAGRLTIQQLEVIKSRLMAMRR